MVMLMVCCGSVATVNAATVTKYDAVQQSRYVTITGTGVRLRYGPGLDYGYYKDAKYALAI